MFEIVTDGATFSKHDTKEAAREARVEARVKIGKEIAALRTKVRDLEDEIVAAQSFMRSLTIEQTND